MGSMRLALRAEGHGPEDGARHGHSGAGQLDVLLFEGSSREKVPGLW